MPALRDSFSNFGNRGMHWFDTDASIMKVL